MHAVCACGLCLRVCEARSGTNLAVCRVITQGERERSRCATEAAERARGVCGCSSSIPTPLRCRMHSLSCEQRLSSTCSPPSPSLSPSPQLDFEDSAAEVSTCQCANLLNTRRLSPSSFSYTTPFLPLFSGLPHGPGSRRHWHGPAEPLSRARTRPGWVPAPSGT